MRNFTIFAIEKKYNIIPPSLSLSPLYSFFLSMSLILTLYEQCFSLIGWWDIGGYDKIIYGIDKYKHKTSVFIYPHLNTLVLCIFKPSTKIGRNEI